MIRFGNMEIAVDLNQRYSGWMVRAKKNIGMCLRKGERYYDQIRFITIMQGSTLGNPSI